MNKLLKNFLSVLLIFLLLSAVFSLISSPFEKVKELSLTQLVDEINQGQIKKITVAGNDLNITYQDDSKAHSIKETETALSQTLLNYGANTEKLKTVSIETQKESAWTSWVGTFLLFGLPLLIFVVFFFLFFRQAKTGAMQAFDFTKARARLFGAEGQSKEKITFKDVAGLKEAKEELKEVVDFLKNPEKFLKMGARIPRGVLLMGPPGTGKTLLARAVASEAHVPFFSTAGSELVELFVGVGAARTRDLFNTAKKHQPSIIFVDELDAIGRIRGTGIGGGHDEREQTLNQILVEMDGFERESTVLIFAASVTGDTPVLIRKNNVCELKPISDIIDSYYQREEENVEKNVYEDFEVLGYQNENGNASNFQSAIFNKVRGVFRHKVKEVFEIEYLGGKIRTTGNHSVFVRTDHGIRPKLVSELKVNEILVDLPYKINKAQEIRRYQFNENFNQELFVWQPLFERFEPVMSNYEYVLANTDKISQTQLGRQIGLSQRTIGKWQQGICGPRQISRNYYQHKYILPEKIKVTPELMRLFGYYMAEGYARKELDFCLHIKEQEKINDIKSLMKDIFGLGPSTERHTTNNAVNIVYYCRPLADFFIYYCGKGAKNKHIPFFLFEAPFKYFQEFLRGYLAGDGYIDKQGRGEITSVSKQIALELNWLFRMHGLKSYLRSFKAKGGRIINQGKPLKETIAWRIGFGKTQNPLQEMDRKIANIKRPIIKKIIKIPYDSYVYDFCGCENEAFFGGNSPILLHNTNRPDVLDPALLRPGRFDRRVVLDLPDINDREDVLKIHSKGKPLSLNVNLREVAERTPGFSGADLANLVNEAAILAARKNKTQVFQEELLESIDKVLLGPERKSHILSKKEKKIAAFHEAGHALVSAFSPGAEPVRKISILARGMAAGYTLKMPTEEKKIITKTEFLAEIATLLGGYTAEKIKFGEITTGAANDLEKASHLARKLVKEYGMSSLGPVAFGDKEELVFLGKEISEQRNYSEEMAAKIDKEVAYFIENSQKVAEKILSHKKALLDKVATTLIEKETIEREEFEKLIKHPTKPEKEEPLPKKKKPMVRVKIRNV